MPNPTPHRVHRPLRRPLIAALVALGLALSPLAASADPYDSDQAGHPVRIAAYVLHPIGVVIDTLILRPAHWLVHQEPLTTLFGHDS